MAMHSKFQEKLSETLKAVLPILIIVMHFTVLGGRNSVLQRPLYGAKRPPYNY